MFDKLNFWFPYPYCEHYITHGEDSYQCNNIATAFYEDGDTTLYYCDTCWAEVKKENHESNSHRS